MQTHPPRNATELRRVLHEAGLRLRKNLGQNFLVDRNLRNALVKDAGLRPGDVVLEIGVGLGILTEGLLEAGARVIGVELDEGMHAVASRLLASYLQTDDGRTVPAADRPLRLVRADALNRKALSPEVAGVLAEAREGAGRLLLVANLPYNIAATVLTSALEWRSAEGRGIDGVGALVQLEVAQRLAAQPGTPDYGALSVLVESHAELKLVRRVPGSVFVPRPKVDSGFVTGRAIAGDRRFPHGLDADTYEQFRRVVHAAFQYRRKRLSKALEFGLQLQTADARAVVADLGLHEDVRGEALAPAQFADLARRVTGVPPAP